jgi:DnaK suppressor protein
MSLGADFLARVRARLDTRGAELRAEVQALQAERMERPRAEGGGAPVEDAGEAGEARVRDAVRQAEQLRDMEELRDVVAARLRLDDGSYGSCLDCGSAIPRARLEAQLTAVRCLPCQQKWEQAHGAPSRLSVLSSP